MYLYPMVIVAGGLATRLRPETLKIPKSLIQINNKPFIFYQLNLLKEKGFTDICLCLGYLGEQIVEYLNSQNNFGLNIVYSFDGEKKLGTGGAIAKVNKFLPNMFFTMYGDSYLDVDYSEIQHYYAMQSLMGGRGGNSCLMTITKNVPDYHAKDIAYYNDKIVVDGDNCNYANYGIGLFISQCFEYKEEKSFDLKDVYKDFAPGCITPYVIEDRFYEIGSHDGLADFEKMIRNKNVIY